jgi:hypothetical protein
MLQQGARIQLQTLFCLLSLVDESLANAKSLSTFLHFWIELAEPFRWILESHNFWGIWSLWPQGMWWFLPR